MKKPTRKFLFRHVMPALLAALLGLSGCADGASAPAALQSPTAVTQTPVFSPSPSPDPDHAALQKALDEAGSSVYDIAWSPDGAMVLFVRSGAGTGQLCLWKTGQAEPIVLGEDSGTTEGFVWSPDGGKFLINVGHMGPGTVTTTIYDAAAVTQIGEELTGAKPSAPLWSPDGSKLCLSQADEETGTVTLTLLTPGGDTGTVLFRSEHAYGPLVLESWDADGMIRFTQSTDTGTQMESAVRAD